MALRQERVTVVRRLEVQAHQADQRGDEALRLAEREVEHGPKGQLGDDSEGSVRNLTRYAVDRLNGRKGTDADR